VTAAARHARFIHITAFDVTEMFASDALDL
jgi:hypothetical protein